MERRAMKPWTIMVAALLGWTSGALPGADAGAEAGGFEASRDDRGGLVDRVARRHLDGGSWRKVMINPSDVGVLSIRYVGRFLATGFYDGRGFVRITRSPEYPNGGPMRIGSLRFQAPVGGTIAAELADDASAASTRRELWTRLASETETSRRVAQPGASEHRGRASEWRGNTEDSVITSTSRSFPRRSRRSIPDTPRSRSRRESRELS